jgi:uncharacterized protein YbbK (DUF523 family)
VVSLVQKVLVSACLLGEAVRYDGRDKRSGHQILQRWIQEGRVVPVCPEVAGGLPIPRPPAEIADGAGGTNVVAGIATVVDINGRDVSEHFLAGANHALACARLHGIGVAVLKEGSPSCGTTFTFDGSFASVKVPNQGVTAALLSQSGVRVFSENAFDEADSILRQMDGTAC